jgi:hypothetical protein
MVREGPDGTENLKKIENFKPRLAELAEQISLIKEWLKVPEPESTSILAVAFVFVPQMLRREPKAGSFLLAVLLAMYHGRFRVLLDTTEPIAVVPLPRYTIKMWSSDTFLLRPKERADNASPLA